VRACWLGTDVFEETADSVYRVQWDAGSRFIDRCRPNSTVSQRCAVVFLLSAQKTASGTCHDRCKDAARKVASAKALRLVSKWIEVHWSLYVPPL
jgi:hypothetical protein